MRRTLGAVSAWSLVAVLLTLTGPRRTDLPNSLAASSAWHDWLAVDPQRALVTVIGVLAWLVFLWLSLGVLTWYGGRLSGRAGRFSRRCAALLLPRLARHVLEATLGTTLAVSVAAPAMASDIPSLERPASPVLKLAPLPRVPAPTLAPTPTLAPAPAVAGAPAPQRPVAEPAPSPTRAPARDPVIGSAPVADTDEVVVHRGDCLWSIVARSLGPTARDADIARDWPRWYAANRSRIGTDAGLLLPGQRLVPPPPAS